MTPACPKCSKPMSFAEYGPWGCWACVSCDRVWMPGEYVRNVFRLTKGAPSIGDVLRRAGEQPVAEGLTCPTCRQPRFGIFETEAATIHACVGCAGVHFGPGQYEAAFPGSQRVLDGGIANTGQMLVFDAAALALLALLS